MFIYNAIVLIRGTAYTVRVVTTCASYDDVYRAAVSLDVVHDVHRLIDGWWRDSLAEQWVVGGSRLFGLC